ncbi:MAG TPA: cystathionine beta-lyase [Caulobacteraceae bacterium]|jgi:cystathionine beta-lyase|nr:cystathionine beta-lyase [Caulobacteraceae bacterium]
MDERTRLLKDANRRTAPRRPVNPPIERATTLINAQAKTLRSNDLGPTYAISGGAVHEVLRDALAELEHAERVFLVPSGLAAATVAILAMLEAGDDVILTDSSYSPTRRFSETQLKRLGITARFAPARANAEELMAFCTDKTRLIVMESPGSLTFEIQDAPAIAAAARERGVRTMLDNTWSAGVYFKPLDHGVDLSVQALSKYVGGHSDVFLGSIAVKDSAVAKRVDDVIEDFGWYVSPDDAYLALRGLRTLPVRLEQHQRSALKVAQWLEQQPEVARVLYPALSSSPDYALWKRDFTGASGLMGVELKPGSREAAEAFLDALKLFGLGFSWGGFESLATYEDPQLRRRQHQAKLGGPLVRLHIGLEGVDDLIADLRQGLDRYTGLSG